MGEQQWVGATVGGSNNGGGATMGGEQQWTAAAMGGSNNGGEQQWGVV